MTALQPIYYIVHIRAVFFRSGFIAIGAAGVDCNYALTTCQSDISCGVKFFYLPGGRILTLGIKNFNSKGKTFYMVRQNNDTRKCQKFDKVRQKFDKVRQKFDKVECQKNDAAGVLGYLLVQGQKRVDDVDIEDVDARVARARGVIRVEKREKKDGYNTI
jgi:hypothetical protein